MEIWRFSWESGIRTHAAKKPELIRYISSSTAAAVNLLERPPLMEDCLTDRCVECAHIVSRPANLATLQLVCCKIRRI